MNRLYFGSRYVVCLADFQTMKEVFNKDVALERPPEIPFAIYQESMSKCHYGIRCVTFIMINIKDVYIVRQS